MNSRLLTPMRIGAIKLANRIVIAPMCQYPADADLGMCSDACEPAMQRTLEAVCRRSGIPIAVRGAHAVRKASTDLRWKGGAQLPPNDPNGWQTEAQGARSVSALAARAFRNLFDLRADD